MPDNKPEREHPYWRLIGLPRLGTREGAMGEKKQPGISSFGRAGGRHVTGNQAEYEYDRALQRKASGQERPYAVGSRPRNARRTEFEVVDIMGAGNRVDRLRRLSTHKTSKQAHAAGEFRANQLGVRHIHHEQPGPFLVEAGTEDVSEQGREN